MVTYLKGLKNGFGYLVLLHGYRMSKKQKKTKQTSQSERSIASIMYPRIE